MPYSDGVGGSQHTIIIACLLLASELAATAPRVGTRSAHNTGSHARCEMSHQAHRTGAATASAARRAAARESAPVVEPMWAVSKLKWCMYIL